MPVASTENFSKDSLLIFQTRDQIRSPAFRKQTEHLQISGDDGEETAEIVELPLPQGQPSLLLVARVYVIAYNNRSLATLFMIRSVGLIKKESYLDFFKYGVKVSFSLLLLFRNLFVFLFFYESRRQVTAHWGCE